MFELKYFDTIRRFEQDEQSGKLEYPLFDVKDLGVDNNFRRAGRWLLERPDRPYAENLRFDAIGVTLDRSGRLVGLEHLEGAF